MNQVAKDALAEKAIKSAVGKFLGEANVRKIIVDAVDDYSGEPSLYVNIYMRNSDATPSIVQRSELRDALREALAELEDDRFTYITILSSYWEGESNGERKSA